jgi:hypothetical protein
MTPERVELYKNYVKEKSEIFKLHLAIERLREAINEDFSPIQRFMMKVLNFIAWK